MTAIVEKIHAAFGEPTHPSLAGYTIQASSSFVSDNNSPVGIRAPHAIRHAQTATRIDRYDISDGSVYYVLADVPAQPPYAVLLQLMNLTPTGTMLVLHSGWRIYDLDSQVTPTEALARLVERYGRPLICGAETETFFARVVVESGGLGLPSDVGPYDLKLEALARILSPTTTEYTWAFALDRASYSADVRVARG